MIGSPRQMRITTWTGPLPLAGHFMRSQGGTVYLVLAVHPNRRPKAERKSVARLDLLKFGRGEEPHFKPGDRIHGFAWNSRRKRR
jgi:hypothetical protein